MAEKDHLHPHVNQLEQKLQLKLKERNPLRKTHQNKTPQGLPLHWNQEW